jgi:CubicO group peptidase (beta-lactamase class C family)
MAAFLLEGIPVNSVHAARLLRFALAAAFSMVAFGAVADTTVPPPPLELTVGDLTHAFYPLMTEWIGKRKGPGAVVVVVTRDATIFAKGYGLSDIGAGTEFTADATLVRPGSISKLFTGIAVMQLVDSGKLDLDRDVNDYIDFAIPTPETGVPVTLRRLLTHRAGFEEHLKGLFSRSREPEPLGRWLANNLPRRLFPKGDVEAYSNYGVALAGYVVERASGEPYATYVQRHILDPLGMRHSTFRQPLPDELAPLMAKGYRTSDTPALGFFETISAAPAGALSATATDMGRFVRALMNGGELNGVRILPKARLDEMMAPASSTPAGYLGLVFFGTRVAGHDAVGHAGGTITFFSDLEIFPEQGIGVFVSHDGIGENPNQIPNPVRVIARRFLPQAVKATDAAPALPADPRVAGVYHSSRRAESSIVRLNDLATQRLIAIDSAGNIRSFSAIWPFGPGSVLKRVEPNLYEGPGDARSAFVDDGFAVPALRLQRVPWWLDARWIVPAFVASTVVALVTLLAWPVIALWRYWRKQPWSRDGQVQRNYLAVRLVLLVDAVVILASAALFIMGSRDLSILNDALDPALLVLYAFAWLGVFGAIPALWTAIRFWRNGIGNRWTRIHHSLMAASSVMLAWFFVMFRIAGTTLIY